MADALLALVTILGAFVYLYADSRLPSLAIGDPLGPKAFPALIGIGLVLSGLLLAFETWRKRRRVAKKAPVTPEDRRHRLILLGMAAWTVLYYAAFEPVGYVLATALYLLGLLAFFNRGRHLVNLAVALCFTAFAYAVFVRFLGVLMPDGLLAL
ncbi:MAG: tripartite tricarboxylate transporter TctB family protein [Proteobacteria bacterium]|nr:tripartite tricarboxylate transporter TctB family protein [Pseudomonadota bacterium]MBI3499966.1 tripartite tricarboxylate transporter TctB family protein [Pseudomonadota bacterium]